MSRGYRLEQAQDKHQQETGEGHQAGGPQSEQQYQPDRAPPGFVLGAKEIHDP